MKFGNIYVYILVVDLLTIERKNVFWFWFSGTCSGAVGNCLNYNTLTRWIFQSVNFLSVQSKRISTHIPFKNHLSKTVSIAKDEDLPRILCCINIIV